MSVYGSCEGTTIEMSRVFALKLVVFVSEKMRKRRRIIRRKKGGNERIRIESPIIASTVEAGPVNFPAKYFSNIGGRKSR